MNSLPWAVTGSTPLAEGRFAELSTIHLSAHTARLLDMWAGPLAHRAPVLVAVTVKGWFVATGSVSMLLARDCPRDLSIALRFGRLRGFDYLFFHCDAPIVTELPRLLW